MAQKGIREYDAKRMMAAGLARHLPGDMAVSYRGLTALYEPQTDPDSLAAENPWLLQGPLVVKPDQLFGKRGKHGLILLNATWKQAQEWIAERMGKTVTVGKTTGELTHFLIEPFVPHDEAGEHYVAIKDGRDADTIYFSMKGGIYVEENWNMVKELSVPIMSGIAKADVEGLLSQVDEARRPKVAAFIRALYAFYAECGFTYLEINPFVVADNGDVTPLDMVAKVDDTAAFDCRNLWKGLEFPKPFGVRHTKEEEYIAYLDEQSGASLKLTVLNPEGRVWAMVAGGGASVIYADTIFDLGFGAELANYGEYSGDPSTELTYNYARTMLDLMTRGEPNPAGKILLIGGGIANFTDVAKTFTGIIQALKEYRDKLIAHRVKIYVRRGGPNYREGLANMQRLGESLGVPIEVYGPETHMTKIVSLALSHGQA